MTTPSTPQEDNEIEEFVHTIGDGWLTEAYDMKPADDKNGEKLLELIENCEADTKAALLRLKRKWELAVIDEVFNLSPKGSFQNWKPTDAFQFYERLKTYEKQLASPTDGGKE